MTTTQIVVLIVFGSAAAVAFLYWCYRISPAGAWKHYLLAHIRSLQARQAALRHDSASTKELIHRLQTEAFGRHLRTIPVEKLTDFPNIGPVTLTKLQDAGCRTLADAVNARFETIAGIGAGRVASLVSAVRSLVKDARSRFDAGACPEAQECRRQVDAMRATEHDHDEARSRELLAIEIALKESFDLYPLATTVTFPDFLVRRPVHGLTDEVMRRPLPEPKPLPTPPAPPPAPTPAPPAVPLSSPAVAAKPAAQSFPLPPVPVAAVPPPPADLFQAALNASPKPTTPPTEHPDLPRMRAVAGFGFMVAKVDGRVTQSEKKAIRAFLEATFGHDPVLRRNLDSLMEKTAKAMPEEAAALAALRAAILATERQRLYAWAEEIADASGERNQKERDALARIAAALELTPVGRVEEALRRAPTAPPAAPSGLPKPRPDLQESGPTAPAAAPSGLVEDSSTRPTKTEPPPDHRAVLDIAPDTPLDADLIRRRFALLTEKLDPARAAAFGPEFARMAEEQRTRIRAAAEALIAPFGEPLEKPTVPPPADIRHNPDLDDVFGA